MRRKVHQQRNKYDFQGCTVCSGNDSAAGCEIQSQLALSKLGPLGFLVLMVTPSHDYCNQLHILKLLPVCSAMQKYL